MIYKKYTKTNVVYFNNCVKIRVTSVMYGGCTWFWMAIPDINGV